MDAVSCSINHLVLAQVTYRIANLKIPSGAGIACIFDRQTPVAVVVVVLAIIGVGVGFVFQPTLVALQANVPQARRAVITSNRNFFRCAGGACGLAVSAAVLQTTLRAHLPSQLAYLAKSPYAIHNVTGADQHVVLDAYMSASNAVFILQVPLIGLCFIGCVLVKDKGLQRPEETSLEQATAAFPRDAEDDGRAIHMVNKNTTQ